MLLLRFALGLTLALPLCAEQPFTLEQILSAPFPSGLTASPRADSIAWVMNAQGVRNIFVATAPRFEPAAVTHFTQDDGQDLSEIAWMPDSSGLYFTRGDDANGRGEFPNPNSNPAGVRQEIWWASIAGEAHKIADGQGAAIAFDGSAVVWIQGSQVWSAATTPTAKPAQLIHARGSAESLTWSPSSHKLAFRSVRTDHSFIGIYDDDAKTLQFIDASVDRDQSPAWSPDGNHIAYLRLAASRYASMHGAKRTGEPWSIRTTDLTTNRSKEIFKAAEGMGSVFWPMTSVNQLLWSADDRIVFPWERVGWLHLYSIPATGGNPALLTPGDYEIEHVALSADRKSIVYSSNEGDIDRRHLWQIATIGGPRQPVTRGAGIEWAPAPLSGAIALLHSDAKTPARVALSTPNNIRNLTALPAGFPSDAQVIPQQIIFPAADGLGIHAQLFLPANTTQPKRPAVIFFHGGSRREMLLGWHYMFYYHQAYAFNQYLASKGYVVLSVNYRSGTGYGEEFREALNYGPTGASEYNDVVGAGLYMKTRPDVDSAHIGLWGGSYGGYLTALGLARASDIFAAGVDLHGVHDWNLEINNFIPAYEAERRLDIARLAFQSSPMSNMDTWKSPVLLIQGDDDRNVPFAESVQLAEELRKHKIPFEQLIFPDEIHDFLIHTHWLQAYRAADDFLTRHLAPAGVEKPGR